VRVHHVERQLHRIEAEAMLLGDVEGVPVQARILVAGEADEAQLARGARVEQGGLRPVVVEDENPESRVRWLAPIVSFWSGCCGRKSTRGRVFAKGPSSRWHAASR
jgi:hypothetical protein